jgi:hypothetical protein
MGLNPDLFEYGSVMEQAEVLLYLTGLCRFTVLKRFTFAPEFCSVANAYSEDRPCGLEVRIPGYRSIGPGSILGATRLSEK